MSAANWDNLGVGAKHAFSGPKRPPSVGESPNGGDF